MEGAKFYLFSAKKIPITNHGSGCTFSASLAVFIAEGHDFRESVRLAKEFTTLSIRSSQKIGRGIAIVSAQQDNIKKELEQYISEFAKLKDAYKLIPEVGTNFVFSKQDPKSISDVVGVSGRIVKSFDSVIVAGSLEYGGSRHVGSALLVAAQKFPKTRSALNIKYDKNLIEKAKSKVLLVKNYQRSDEPKKTKKEEGGTIPWGIKDAIKDLTRAPDVIFHTGDVGKEPMSIIFGTNPKEVVRKLAKLTA